MEILQNLGNSSSLQSHIKNTATNAVTTPTQALSNGDSSTDTAAPSNNIQNIPIIEELTERTLRELDHVEPAVNFPPGIILGSGDMLHDSNSIKFPMDSLDSCGTSVPAPSTKAHESQVDDSQVNLVINNVVCTFSTRCHLNLKELALRGENVEYKKAQGMLNMKIRNPSATASIWSSGKITVTGANSEDACRTAARKIARKIQKLGFNVKFSSYRVVNVLGTCTLPFGILLTQFSEANIGRVQYEPELHPGATYQIKDIRATLKIFSTGSITITAPKVGNIQKAVEHVFPMVYSFKKPKKVDPVELRYIEEQYDDSEAEVISDNSDLDLEPGEIPSTKSKRFSDYHRGSPVVARPSPTTYSRVSRAKVPATIVISKDDYGSSSSDDGGDMDSD